MTKVVLATGNPGKVAEMQVVLQEFGLEVVAQSKFDIPEAIEDGLSFVENAIIKARHACQLTQLPAIADDSGLEVDVLDGAPGIYSSRYADGLGDQANNRKLLQAMAGNTNRAARFQCVIVFMQHAHDPTPIICQGAWEGEIATQAVGENGFGYDPIFYLPDHDCSSAELDPSIKKQLSHRAKALALLKNQLENSI
jgi:XTP/dITP diphosphohydrolase